MYKSLYNLSILLYNALVFLLQPINRKAASFIESRSKNRYSSVPSKSSSKRIWIHASSLGEFEQGRPLIEKIRSNLKEVEIILTFFSPSGFEIRKNYDQVDYVTYIPIDTLHNARKFVNHVDPDLSIMIKYEFWLNHLQACFESQIPVIYISVILRPDQIYFNGGKSLYLNYFRKIKQFFVQNEESMDLLLGNGIDGVQKVGDTRFDRVIDIAENSDSIDVVENFLQGKKAIILGSMWMSDLDIIAEYFKGKLNDYKIILAPHNIDQKEVSTISEIFESSCLFSEFKDEYQNRDVLIIDNMGMLSSLYKYGKYAIIGGGFRGALHNTLEAAVYGIPVLFGRHSKNRKFNEAQELIAGGGAFEFSNANELEEIMGNLEGDESHYKKSAEFCKSYVYREKGSTDKILDYIKPILN